MDGETSPNTSKEPKERAPTSDEVKKALKNLMQTGKKITDHAFKQGTFNLPPTPYTKSLSVPGWKFGAYTCKLFQIQFSFIDILNSSQGILTKEEHKEFSDFIYEFADIITEQLKQRAQAENRRSNHVYFVYATTQCKTLREMLFGDWRVLEEEDGEKGVKDEENGGKNGKEGGGRSSEGGDEGFVGSDGNRKEKRRHRKKKLAKETVEPKL